MDSSDQISHIVATGFAYLTAGFAIVAAIVGMQKVYKKGATQNTEK
jgi:hypothetical protein